MFGKIPIISPRDSIGMFLSRSKDSNNLPMTVSRLTLQASAVEQLTAPGVSIPEIHNVEFVTEDCVTLVTPDEGVEMGTITEVVDKSETESVDCPVGVDDEYDCIPLIGSRLSR